MKVAIASDHAGFDQKAKLADYIKSLNFDVIDFGPDNNDKVDYPDYAEKVGRAVSSGNCNFGVLVCGTGVGMAVAANKIKGIRAVNVINPHFAHLSREHNDANIITLSGRFVELETNKLCIGEFLHTDFEGGRHAKRVEKIKHLEEQ